MKKINQPTKKIILLTAITLIITTKLTTILVSGDKVIIKNGQLNVTSLITDTNTIYTDSTNNRVGIGTTNPQCKIDTDGTIRSIGASTPTSGTGIEMRYSTTDDSGGIVSYNRSSSTFKPLKIYGDDVLINPDGGGNVGIGTANPGAFLEVYHNDWQLPLVRMSRSSTNAIDYYPSAGTPSSASVKVFRSGVNTTAYSIFTDTSGDYTEGDVKFGEDVFFDGKVGIGTTSPDAALHIVRTGTNGAPTVEGIQAGVVSNYASLEMTGTNGAFIDFQNDTSGTDYDMRIIVPDDDSMGIMGGKVGINTSNPGATLEVNGDLTVTGGVYRGEGSIKVYTKSCSCPLNGGTVSCNSGDVILSCNMRSDPGANTDTDWYINAATNSCSTGSNDPAYSIQIVCLDLT